MSPSFTDRFLFGLALALLLVLGPRRLDAQDAGTSRVERATDVLESFMDTTHVPGFSGAIAVGGDLVWTDGFGYANLQHRVPATEDTRYRIASISKPIAATVAIQLAEERTLDLDAPVRSYLPLFPKKRDTITTRHLLSHTSGIRHFRDDEFRSATRFESRLGPLAIFADDSLLYEPGSTFHYSSYGYTLASAVMEAASDSTFLELLKARITDPLGLETLGPEKTEAVIPNEASFYVVERTKTDTTVVNAPYVDNSNKWTGGGLLAAPKDVVRFALALLDGRLLTERGLEVMMTPQAIIENEPYDYGLGWFMGQDVKGHPVVWHTGGAMGGSGVLLLLPDQDIVISTLANASDVPHFELAKQMARTLLGRDSTE